MDEPLSNLDAKLRAQTRLELVDLHRRVETTVVYVTHDQVEAITMADRIAVMSAGRLQQVGTPQEVYEAPANLFVAQFIGTPPMNTLEGELVDGGIDTGGGVVPVPPGLPGRLEDGRKLVVGIRPEHLTLTGRAGSLSWPCGAVEWLGHECLVFGTIGGADAVVRQTGMAEVRRATRPGWRPRPPMSTCSTPRRWSGWREHGHPAPAPLLLYEGVGPGAGPAGPVHRRVRRLLLPALPQPAALGPVREPAQRRLLRVRGPGQYREQLTGEDFREGLWHSIQFVLYTVPPGIVLGVLLAVAAHRRLKGIKIFQAIFSSTLASSVAVTSVLFFYFFNDTVACSRWTGSRTPTWRCSLRRCRRPGRTSACRSSSCWPGCRPSPTRCWRPPPSTATAPPGGCCASRCRLVSPVLLFLLVVLVIFGLRPSPRWTVTKGGPGAGQHRDVRLQDQPAQPARQHRHRGRLLGRPVLHHRGDHPAVLAAGEVHYARWTPPSPSAGG